jgi:hypothetical protein
VSTSAQETPATPAAPIPGPPAAPEPPTASACARCDAALRPGQDWCLECGAATRTTVAGPRGWRLPLLIAAAIALFAGAGAAIWLVSLSDDASTQASSLTTAAAAVPVAPVAAPGATTAAPPARAKTTTVTRTKRVTKTVTAPGAVVTAATRTVTAPSRTVTVTTPAPAAPSGPISGPVPGWPANRTGYTVVLLSGTRAAAFAKARSLRAGGTRAGVLDTHRFSATRATGRYVVFSGSFGTPGRAAPVLQELRLSDPGSFVSLIRPLSP